MSAPFTVHRDERGDLLPVDFADLPFAPRRAFVVTAPAGGSSRGGHAAPCRELLVLVAGEVVVRHGSGRCRLALPGEHVLVEAGEHLEYVLSEGASILVLADRPYES